MIKIKELQIAKHDCIKNIAKLHKKSFPSFFLTQLGEAFLCQLYSGYMEDDESGIIVAEIDDKIIGFIAYSRDYPQFFRGLIKKHLFKFVLYSLVALVHHPYFIKRLFRAFEKSESVIKEDAYVELASICVNPEVQGSRVGSKMIDYLKHLVDFKKYAYINLETDADMNESVNNFYIKNGFKLARQFTTPEGRRMNEYRYTTRNEV